MDQVANRDLDALTDEELDILERQIAINTCGSCLGAPSYGVSAIVSFFSRCSRWSLRV